MHVGHIIWVVLPHQVGPTGPTYMPTGPLGPHVIILLLRRFSTALRIASTPFIQVSLIRELRIDAPVYIYQPLPPLGISPITKSFEKTETLIILRAPPYSRA